MSSLLKVYAQSYQPTSKIFHNHLTFTFTPEMNYYIHLFCLHCNDKLLVEDCSIDFFYEFLFHIWLYAIGCKQDICTHLLSSLILLCHWHHCLGNIVWNKGGLFLFELSELCDITVSKTQSNSAFTACSCIRHLSSDLCKKQGVLRQKQTLRCQEFIKLSN